MSLALERANELLAANMLAGIRISRWEGASGALRVELFHVDWPATVFGALVFRDVSFVQLPARISWGYVIRSASRAGVPSLANDVDPTELVYELESTHGAS